MPDDLQRARDGEAHHGTSSAGIHGRRALAAGTIAAIARRPGSLIAATGVLCALAYAASLLLFPKPDGRVVVGDAVHYFVYLRSLVFDGDLRFQDEYFRLYGLAPGMPPPPGTEWVFTPLPTGYTRNLMPIGTALVWLPLYIVTVLFSWMLHAVGVAGAPDGFSRACQASAGMSGIAAATLGAWLSYRFARELFGASVALPATLAVWLGSSALYYSLVSPTYSHAASMLATSLAMWTWWRTRHRRTVGRYAVVGALVGLAALVRVQDVVFLAAPLFDAARDLVRGTGSPRARGLGFLSHAGAAGAGAVVAFAPQMLAWSAIYGSPFLVPQGSDFMRWTEPHVWDVLFSTFRGLFTWTPVLALAIAGLVLLARTRGELAIVLAAIFVLSCYVNGAVADWWAGEAFGARRFVSCFPVFVVGGAAALDRWRGSALPPRMLVVCLVLFNLLLLFQYQLFLKGWRDIAPYPDDLWSLWIARFVVPLRVLARMLGG